MKKEILLIAILLLVFNVAAFGQIRQPSSPNRPFVVKKKQDVSAISKSLSAQSGNKNEDIVAAAGLQTRVAIFHDEKRVDDLNEVHDSADDVYYVLDGTATLQLGGTLVDPNEISPGEWRSKTATGGQKIAIKKGDLIVVPRGTPHQRTVTGKGFSMILIKIFAEPQPAK